jgi:hypothetical protein
MWLWFRVTQQFLELSMRAMKVRLPRQPGETLRVFAHQTETWITAIGSVKWFTMHRVLLMEMVQDPIRAVFKAGDSCLAGVMPTVKILVGSPLLPIYKDKWARFS